MNKRRRYSFAASLLVLVLLLVGCLGDNSKETTGTNKGGNKPSASGKVEVTPTEKETTGTNNGENKPTAAEMEEFIPTEYETTVKVNVEEKTLNGALKVKSTNYTGKNQDKIYFHVYPNQFREGVDLLGGFWRQIIDENSQPGSMDVTEVQVNGETKKFAIKDTVLEIPLEKWEKGQTIDLEFKFTIKIPKNNGRLSYDDHTMWLGNWIPIQAVYDERGWVTDPYYSIGDPFYSQVGKYTVNVKVPSNYKIASTGKETEGIKEQDGSVSYTTSIENVRDFALVIMDETYQKLSDQVGDTTVNTWYLTSDSPEAVKQNHEVGIKALAYFSEVYGDYPYPEYDIVRTGMFTPMEFPGLIYLTKEILTSNELDIGSVVHETAHQWWYGMVGNDEVREPWLDEALATYASTKFMLEEFPEREAELLKARMVMTGGTEQFERNGIFIGSPVDKFNSIGAYSMLVYQKGALMLENLEKEIGKEKMDHLLSIYFKENQYGIATRNEFISVFSKELGPEAKEYFDGWLNGKKPKFIQ
jgi:hypothetical protein